MGFYNQHLALRYLTSFIQQSVQALGDSFCKWPPTTALAFWSVQFHPLPPNDPYQDPQAGATPHSQSAGSKRETYRKRELHPYSPEPEPDEVIKNKFISKPERGMKGQSQHHLLLWRRNLPSRSMTLLTFVILLFWTYVPRPKITGKQEQNMTN